MKDKLFQFGDALAIILFAGYFLTQSKKSTLVGVPSATAATTSAVTVTATVGTSISCSTDNSSTAFGTLTTGSITTSTPTASTTMSCNIGNGCTLYINDVGNGANGGLATTSPAYLIPSPNAAYNATATLVAATEGYGVIGTTTAVGSGGALGIAARYLQDFAGNTVGGLTVSTLTLASSTVAVSNREVVVKHKAAISGTTQAASYTDTITYTCLSN